MVVIACGALASEIMALKRLNSWEFELTCVPAQLHNRPKKITGAVEKKLLEAKARGEKVFVAFADCGTGGQLDALLERHGVERLAGAHCYEFFAGTEVFMNLHDEEPGTLYLTDFLARHFEALIMEGLGLNKHPQLFDLYFGNYKRVVYLAQTDNSDYLARAQAAAERLGLAFENRFTAYGDLETKLSSILSSSANTALPMISGGPL